MTAFEELGVIPELGDSVNSMGWQLPTPIQCDAIPAILGGGDVLIAAETGSGKTGAFCLPVTQIVWEKRKDALDPKRKAEKAEPSWRLNLSDRDGGLTLDAEGLKCETKTPKLWFGARVMGGVHTKGKYYYEARIDGTGLARFGWGDSKGTRNIGTDDHSFGYGATGMSSYENNFEKYGEKFGDGDVIGCYLDLDSLKMWWSKNGVHFPSYDVFKDFRSPLYALHPAITLQASTASLNLGDTPFVHPPPQGFVGVSSAPKDCTRWSTIGSVNADLSAPLCIVLEPTREMVEQTHHNLVHFSKELTNPPLRCLSMAAGAAMKQAIAQLSQGTDIVSGTPQRVVDLIETGKLSLSSLQFLVIDEADQFLCDSGGTSFLLNRLFQKLPLVAADGCRLQVIVCSATLHNANIKKFASQHLHNPQWIDLKGMDSVADRVHHVVCTVDAASDKQWIRLMHAPNHLEDDHIHDEDPKRMGTNDKNTVSFGTKVLKGVYVLKAIEALRMEQCLLFCRTKQQCDHMEAFLIANGRVAACLHGDRPPEERSRALEGFKDKSIPFLICTDVAARGIDVDGLPFVINVTLPAEKDVYVHRVGRVGRAERMGLSISLVSCHPEKVWYHTCRGGNCGNPARCSIWYQERELLAEIEDSIGQTIALVDSDFAVPVDEFEGNVVYGARSRGQGTLFEGHAPQMATSVAHLADLERQLQHSYLSAALPLFKKLKVL